jgi:dipeptide/tripeptide permease
MYDQVKKSWAKQSVALDVSTVLISESYAKSPNFMKEKTILILVLNLFIFKYLFYILLFRH